MLNNQRRKTRKLERLPSRLKRQAKKRLAEGQTYKAVSEEISEQGHSVSPSAVGRYYRDWTSAIEKTVSFRRQIDALAQTLKEKPNSEMAEAAEQLLMTKLMDMLLSIFDTDYNDADPVKLATAISQLQRSGMLRERLKLDYRKYFDKAGASAFGQFYRDLMGYLKMTDIDAHDALIKHFDGFTAWVKEIYKYGFSSDRD